MLSSATVIALPVITARIVVQLMIAHAVMYNAVLEWLKLL
jgi:hypothetical protein